MHACVGGDYQHCPNIFYTQPSRTHTRAHATTRTAHTARPRCSTATGRHASTLHRSANTAGTAVAHQPGEAPCTRAAQGGQAHPLRHMQRPEGDSNTPQQPQEPSPRVRIQLPSFRQVQAAERPSAPVSTFVPGRINAQPQPQQPQPQPQPQQQQWQQPQPARHLPAGGHAAAAPAPPQQQLHSAAAAAAAAAAVTAAGATTTQLSQPSWAAGLPSLGVSAALPRFTQSSGAAGSSAAAAAGAGSLGALAQQQATHAQQTHPQQQQAPLNAVLVSRRQQGNPVLKQIRHVRWVFADIVPDYLCGQHTAVLFLSLRYHLLQPEYILSRLQALQRAYRLSVLLLLVDAEEVVKPLLELHKAALGAQAVLVCAWSNEEVARYIEALKAYENKPASSIMQHTDTDYMGRLSAALTSIRGINRSDAYNLARHSGTLADAFRTGDAAAFAAIPGLGPVKAKRLVDTFQQPFKKTPGAARPAAAAAAAATQAAAGGVGAAAAGVLRTDAAAAATTDSDFDLDGWEEEEEEASAQTRIAGADAAGAAPGAAAAAAAGAPAADDAGAPAADDAGDAAAAEEEDGDAEEEEEGEEGAAANGGDGDNGQAPAAYAGYAGYACDEAALMQDMDALLGEEDEEF